MRDFIRDSVVALVVIGWTITLLVKHPPELRPAYGLCVSLGLLLGFALRDLADRLRGKDRDD